MAAQTNQKPPDFFTRSIIKSNPHKVNKNDKRFRFDCKHREESANNIIKWCEENFGGSRRNTWGYSSINVIYITQPDIVMAFKLRWL